ncbi:MAG: hypothetical protein GH144_10100 [Clostridia bacterium]|jgi:hypothetical protein|nr:hypothetical protein [Clostridia bacterium]
MTNLSSGLVTDDYDLEKEVEKIRSIKGSLDKIATKYGNPHRQLFKDYISGKVSVDELHKVLRGKLLKTVYKMKREKYPPKPTKKSSANMDGWGRACASLGSTNAGNKYWLGVLLNDIIEGKLEAEQGKREEIEELLSEWY